MPSGSKPAPKSATPGLSTSASSCADGATPRTTGSAPSCAIGWPACWAWSVRTSSECLPVTFALGHPLPPPEHPRRRWHGNGQPFHPPCDWNPQRVLPHRRWRWLVKRLQARINAERQALPVAVTATDRKSTRSVEGREQSCALDRLSPLFSRDRSATASLPIGTGCQSSSRTSAWACSGERPSLRKASGPWPSCRTGSRSSSAGRSVRRQNRPTGITSPH